MLRSNDSREIGPLITTKNLVSGSRTLQKTEFLYVYERLKMEFKIIFLRFESKFLMDDISQDDAALHPETCCTFSIYITTILCNYSNSLLLLCLSGNMNIHIHLYYSPTLYLFFQHCPTSDLYLVFKKYLILIISLSWFHSFFINLISFKILCIQDILNFFG